MVYIINKLNQIQSLLQMSELNSNETRPTDLTSNFIPILVQKQCTRLGIFQIVEFYQKRQHLYSTKISDGFFRIKVMFAYNAGKMISEGKVKLFSIINGEVQNHGQGVFIVKKIQECWDFQSVVGYFKDWKKSTPNVNLFGSNTIKWQTMQEISYHQTATFCPTVSQRKNEFSITQSKQSKLTSGLPKDNKEINATIIKNKTQQPSKISPTKQKKKLLLSSQESQQSQTNKNYYSYHQGSSEKIVEDGAESEEQQFFDNIINQLQIKAKSEQQHSNESLTSLKRIEKSSQSEQLIPKIKKVDEEVRRNSQLIKDRLNAIDDLFQESSDEDVKNQIKDQLKLKISQKDNKQIDMQNNDLAQQSKATIKKISSSRLKSSDVSSSSDEQYNLKWVATQIEKMTQNPSISLKSQYQINKQQQTKNQYLKSPQKQTKNNQEQEEDFQWVLQFHKNAIIRSPYACKQGHSSNIKQQFSNEKKSEHCIFKSDEQILFNQLHPKINKFWWVKAKVIGKGQLHYNTPNKVEISSFTTILKDKNDTLIEAKFIDVDYNTIQVERFYKLGGGIIKRSFTNKYKGCDLELQFKSSTQSKNIQNQFKIQERGAVFHDNPQNFNYCLLSKIDNLAEDTLINVIGLIKQVTTSKTKTGKYMIIYEIIDPIESTATTLTEFVQKSPNVQNQAFLGNFISVYNAKVNLFRGKRSLMMRNNTIINIGLCQPTPHAISIKYWLDNSKNIEDFQPQLNYKQCFNIREALQDINLQEFKLSEIKLLAFANKYEYLACVSCFKKVDSTKPVCRQCGPRSHNEYITRKFIRATIGDWSGICQIVWGDTQANKMLINGFQRMIQLWQLSSVDLWVSRGKNNTFNVKKIKKNEIRSKNKKTIQFLKQRVFF